MATLFPDQPFLYFYRSGIRFRVMPEGMAGGQPRWWNGHHGGYEDQDPNLVNFTCAPITVPDLATGVWWQLTHDTPITPGEHFPAHTHWYFIRPELAGSLLADGVANSPRSNRRDEFIGGAPHHHISWAGGEPSDIDWPGRRNKYEHQHAWVATQAGAGAFDEHWNRFGHGQWPISQPA